MWCLLRSLWLQPDSSSETPDTTVLLDYLAHENPEDLQFLTINDYTFICNRGVKPSTTTSVVNVRPNEGFIELRNLAYRREYSVAFNTVDDTDGLEEAVVSAASISCNKVDWEDKASDCKFTAIENFTVDDTENGKEGLSFKIETRTSRP